MFIGFFRLIVLCLLIGAVPAAAAGVTVFAAASTAPAVEEVSALFSSRHGVPVRTVFASSSTLARQIVNGAPADLYISANVAWMDYATAGGAIEAASRVDLLGNRLVLIAPADSTLALHIAPGFPLAAKLGDGRLAMGDPDHVPAGIYGKAALEHLGAWPAVAASVVRFQDARAALALVERGEAAAGIAYATDAAITDGVRLIAKFPTDSHPPITYPLAMVVGRDRPEVRKLYDFLLSRAASAVFERHGFAVTVHP